MGITRKALKGDSTEKARVCFIILPIGDIDSNERKQAEGLISLIKPTIEENNYSLKAAHTISKSGTITHQIIELLIESDLVIAVLTSLNPNVMYELGVRHSSGKPSIPIIKNGTTIPFDIADVRTIMYEDGIAYSTRLISDLNSMIKEINLEALADNPVTNYLQRQNLAQTKEEQPINYIIDRLDSIENKIHQMARPAHTFPRQYSLPVEVELHPLEQITLSEVVRDLLKTLNCQSITTEYTNYNTVLLNFTIPYSKRMELGNDIRDAIVNVFINLDIENKLIEVSF